MHAHLLEAYACKSSLWADSCRVYYHALLEQHSHEIWSETNICNWGAGTPQKVFANKRLMQVADDEACQLTGER